MTGLYDEIKRLKKEATRREFNRALREAQEYRRLLNESIKKQIDSQMTAHYMSGGY